MINNKPKAMKALGRKAANAFTPALNNIQGTPNKVTEDMAGWNPKTMGNKRGTLSKQKNAIRQYGDKGYKPSNGIGVGH